MKTEKIDNSPNSKSEVIDNDSEDDDTCTPLQLEHLFQHKYKIHDELAISDESYIISLAKDDFFTCIAAGLSDGSVRLFEINSEKGFYIEPPTTDTKITICGTRFVDETPNLLLVGTTNGLVRLLDLRTQNEVSRFDTQRATEFKFKEILSLDRNSNSRLLCVGTVAQQMDVNLLFYDLRTSNLLFRYLESHQDDVTTLRFHPQNPNLLCSGSTDGLINIFDVTANDEDDAILTTINTENSVYKVNWHKKANYQDIVSCVTHTSSFSSYEFDGEVIAKFDRLKITEAFKRKNEAYCNLVDCHSMNDHSLMLLIGSNFNNGATLRSCKVHNGQILPYGSFKGNSQIVRESIFDVKSNILITAGESGNVTLWTPLEWENLASQTHKKMHTKSSNKYTPY